jgi:biotin operon repressor
MNIDFFTNDRYKILDCMQQRQIDISGYKIVPLSQRQISGITGMAYKTVNNIIKELKANGYIIHKGTTRGNYLLTDKARIALTQIQSEGAKQ